MPFHRYLVLVFFILGLTSGITQSIAADAKSKMPSPLIALIDMQRVLDESTAAKAVKKQLESQRSKFQIKTESEENELRQAEEDLNKSRGQMSTDVYAEREQQLRQRFLTVERHVQARRKVLDQGFADAMNEVRTNLQDIVQDVAHERGVNLVLIKQQALWADKDFDVTDEVLDHLNKKLPQVTVKLNIDDND